MDEKKSRRYEQSRYSLLHGTDHIWLTLGRDLMARVRRLPPEVSPPAHLLDAIIQAYDRHHAISPPAGEALVARVAKLEADIEKLASQITWKHIAKGA